MEEQLGRLRKEEGMDKGRTGDEGHEVEGRLGRWILRKEEGMEKGRTGDEGHEVEGRLGRGTVREEDGMEKVDRRLGGGEGQLGRLRKDDEMEKGGQEMRGRG